MMTALNRSVEPAELTGLAPNDQLASSTSSQLAVYVRARYVYTGIGLDQQWQSAGVNRAALDFVGVYVARFEQERLAGPWGRYQLDFRIAEADLTRSVDMYEDNLATCTSGP